MEKDSRYKAVKILFDNGHIKSFEEIWNYIPMELVAKDLGERPHRFKKKFENMGLIKVGDLFVLAKLFGIDELTFTSCVVDRVDLS